MDGVAGRESAASGTSSGACPSRTTRVKCASASAAASFPCERPTTKRASASFASIGSSVVGSAGGLHHEPVVLGQRLVRDPHRLPELLLGRLGEPDVVAERGAHLAPVGAHEERRRERDLRLEPVGLHHVAAGEQVVELIGAAELDVRLDRRPSRRPA